MATHFNDRPMPVVVDFGAQTPPAAPARVEPTERCQSTVVEAGALSSGEGLDGGEGLASPSGRFVLSMLADGRLELCDGTDGSTVWSVGGPQAAGLPAVLRRDGNFGIFAGTDTSAFWATNTDDTSADELSVTDSGNVVLRSIADEYSWWESQSEVSVSKGRPPRQLDRLEVGERLTVVDFLQSPDGRYRLDLTSDGSILLSDGAMALWESDRSMCSDVALAMQADGNLVMYANPMDPDPRMRAAVGSSLGDGSPASALVLGNDGSLTFADWGGADLRDQWNTSATCS
ncbi:hypothetical protein WDZ17_16760 [Pseudokineococcus basanitobsidens]|uniref:Bulb-type lectin domain-containing protein n=1 Tax=Pseudokineococcus basanitobsidens TaxID=1926649 RepID=A0ABU8RPA9_9ACTN